MAKHIKPTAMELDPNLMPLFGDTPVSDLEYDNDNFNVAQPASGDAIAIFKNGMAKELGEYPLISLELVNTLYKRSTK